MRARMELPPLVVEALAELKQRLAASQPGRLREVRVFGSVARGEAGEHSDMDVLVVLDEIRTHADRVTPMEIAPDVGLPHGLIIQALVFDEDELALQRKKETALAEVLDRDGIVI